jgi:DNA-binding transcriptional regulator YiaG
VKAGSKYWPLFEALSRSGQEEVTLTLETIEARLGQPLPPSARAGRSWWSNRKGAPQAAAWMEAGYHTARVDLEGGAVKFVKTRRAYQVRREGDTIVWDRDLIHALRTHMDLNQTAFAEELGVRQQTVSEWETGLYAPSRAMCKYLTLVAERAGFGYES